YGHETEITCWSTLVSGPRFRSNQRIFIPLSTSSSRRILKIDRGAPELSSHPLSRKPSRSWRAPHTPTESSICSRRKARAFVAPLCRPNILIHAKQIVRIITPLDLGKARVVEAIGHFDPISLIARHEVDVGRSGG